ncbi:MAG: glycosyltransferase family 39 protein [Planctomycetaceae bacterium]
MSTGDAEPTSTDRSSNAARWILVAIITSFWVCRLPVMLRQIPAQDEDYFAVPGWTILQTGLPSIPYLPSRDETAAFYRADDLLYALPPLYFYSQAAVYAVTGPGTGAARVASALAGTLTIWAVYALGRVWLPRRGDALWAAALFAWSRVFYFPCVIARPDMLCGLFGVLSLLTASWWWTSGRLRWLIAAAAAIGGGFLTHPFAIVFALQVGLWSLCRGPSWFTRLRDATVLTTVALLVAALWIPLILVDPDLFVTQFGNNVFNKAGAGVLSRLLWPIESLRVQWPLFVEHTGPLQVILLTVSSGVAVARVDLVRTEWKRPVLLLATVGLYLHIALQGTHPTKGYWVYTLVPGFLLAGSLLSRLTLRTGGAAAVGPVRFTAAALLAAALLLPGAGVRTLLAHLRHWNDTAYNAPAFTQELLSNTPSDGVQVVDPGYAFEFHLAGRKTLLGLNFPFFYDVSDERYHLLVAGPTSLRDGVPAALEAEYQRSFGDKADLFACYSELYTAPPHRRPVMESH